MNKAFIITVEEYKHCAGITSINRYIYKVCESLDDALTHIDHFENQNNKRVELTYSNQLKKYIGQCIKDGKISRINDRIINERGYVTEYYVNIEEYLVSGPRKSNHESMLV